ncbi:MAG: 8-oxoguanine DNA glycosylase, N-terminal domain-containing protein, partial [Dehalococcoidia bacterium]|nr:8-oxoguanine DNA glycosylase, N-terminal domain-containing protein [Dehalococcoidia bacterium]
MTDTVLSEPVFLPIGYVDLQATLDGGQAFRWWPGQNPDSSQPTYRGVVGRRVVEITEADDGLLARPTDGRDESGLAHSLTDYLGSRQDLEGFRKRFADDPCLGPALRGYSGLRVLRQDPWECLFSFICSSTSNIP